MSAFRVASIRAARHRWTAAFVALLAGASLLFAGPAQAYDIPEFEIPLASQAPVPFVERAVDAAGVLDLWRAGGPATRAAAQLALVGGPEAVQAFLDGGQDVALATDRKELVTELTKRGSAHVRSSAKAALISDAATIAFLSDGWASTWDGDLRTTATFFTSLENPQISAAASKSLDSGGEAIEQFVLEGWRKIAQGQDREAVYYLTNSPVPAVTLGAQAALDTSSADFVADFLRYGQFVASDHHTETAAVTDLLQQVKADVAANPNGAAAVAERARTAVEQARSTATAARSADSSRLVADRDFLSSLASPRQATDTALLTSEEPAKAAFAAAAREIPELLATLTAPGTDLDARIKEARQATLDLALTGTPEVKKTAEAAHLAGDSGIKAFITSGYAAAIKLDGSALGADRQRVYQLLHLGGGHVNAAADAALSSANHADVRYFLDYGFDQALALDNRVQTTFALDSTPEVRAAASVALDGSRADLQAFMTSGKAAAAERDKATAAHVASVDVMIAELAGLADKAALDAGTAANAAKSAEAARQAEAARRAEEARQAGAVKAAEAALPLSGVPLVDVHQLAGSAPALVPWQPAPAVVIPATGETGGPGTGLPALPPPAGSANPNDIVSVEPEAQEAATAASTSQGLNPWTIGLIALLVAAAAGGITLLLRRKTPAKAALETSVKAQP